MEYVIQHEQGILTGHPIAYQNYLQAFKQVPGAPLLPGFMEFRRVECPPITRWQIFGGGSIQVIDGIATDVWDVRDMTPEERADARARYYAEPHVEGTSFDEELGCWRLMTNVPGAAPNVI